MPTPLFAGPQMAAAVERARARTSHFSRGGTRRRHGEAAVRAPNPRQQRETTADDPMHPPQQKKFAQKQRRRRNRARRGPGPPSRRAPPPTGGGHTARAAGCGAHAGASASLQHHDGSGRDFSHGARAPCFQSAKGYTFWPPSSGRCGWASPPLRVRLINLSPQRAPATSLSIIFIACSPLLPRSTPFPASTSVSFHRKRQAAH